MVIDILVVQMFEFITIAFILVNEAEYAKV